MVQEAGHRAVEDGAEDGRGMVPPRQRARSEGLDELQRWLRWLRPSPPDRRGNQQQRSYQSVHV